MDDEPRSVRVEVKDASTSIVGGLDTAVRAGDPPRWPVVALGGPVAQPAQEVVFLESADALTWTIVDMASIPDRFDELGELFVDSIAVATDGTDLFGGQGSWIPASVITPLRLGGVAFVSGGARQDWSIVTVEAESGFVGAFAIPFDTDEISEATLLDVAVLGETREFADRSPHLLVDVRGQLWSLNTQWGEWTQIFDPSDLDAEGEAGPFQLSSDGDRVYQPSADGLRMIELEEDDDGVLPGQIRSALLGPPEWFSSVRAIEISTILAASNNKLLFYNDQQLWPVEPPPPLDEDA